MLCTPCYRAGTICQWEIDWRLALGRLRSEDIRKERAVVSDFDAPCRGSLQSSWRNDGCGSRFGGRLFRGVSIMKSETLQEFKQFWRRNGKSAWKKSPMSKFSHTIEKDGVSLRSSC